MDSQTAEIFYHVKKGYKQKIVVDGDNSKGNIIFPELEKRDIEIKNLRGAQNAPSFQKNSLEFCSFKTKVKSFQDGSFKKVYNQELEHLVTNIIGAKEVIVFDHTVRADDSLIRPPARHAHIDYSKKSALEQIDTHIKGSEKKNWIESHFALINAWKPIENKVQSAPLGFVLPQSTPDDDLIEIDLVYPSRVGEVLGALYNQTHEWVYLSEMEPDEIVLFNMFDSRGRQPVIHSAFDLKNNKIKSIRKSIESRILIRF